MLKNKNFLLTVILPVIISLIIGILIIVLNNQSVLNTRALTQVLGEKNAMNSAISSLSQEKKELLYTQADYEKQIEDNRLLFEEIQALTTELNSYTESIDSAKSTIAELDKTITDKKKYNESLDSLSKETQSGTKSYKNTKLNVPQNIAAGRYKAQGTGTILIYTIAGTLEEKQNLSVLDSHSYTFNITSGQSIKIEGTVSLTRITV